MGVSFAPKGRAAMNSDSPTVAIVGGGLSGLAAAVAAAERGFRVEVFEQAKSLGGRASSFVDSKTGQRIDHCRHVAMGCCASFLDFCRRTGIDDCFERTATLHFFGPEGDRHDFTPSRWLPAPLHLLPGLMRLKYLSLGERWGIIKALHRLKKTGINEKLEEKEEEETIGDWLRRHGQSDRALERFWSVVLTSALGESLDHASLAAARKVFLDGFLASRSASDLILPQMTLGEIFNDRLGRWLEDHGVKVHLGASVKVIEGDEKRAHSIVLADGTRREFDVVVLAVHWRMVRMLLAENLLAALPELEKIKQIQPAAITAVHLWFDRPITPLPHAVLIGRLSQWVFTRDNYCQVVISASHRLPERGYDEVFEDVCRELNEIFSKGQMPPGLIHGRVTTQPSAVFSMQPNLDRFRPPQKTPIENLVLAGDWTATGWPGTMEGAVRSGFLAAEILQKMSPLPQGAG
jgi:squalene-associated FAD-dependent desaturase